MEAELRARGLPLRLARDARARCATSTWSASRCSSSSRSRTSSRCSTSAASRCAAADRGEDDPLVIAGGPTATHPEPLAPFIDAFVHRRRRGAHARARARLGATLQARRACRARERLARARDARRRLRAVALRDRASTPTPASRSSARRSIAACRRCRSSARSSPTSASYPFPDDAPGRRHRGHVRSRVGRDRARLHRGLPVLPGGHDLPARCASAIPQ